jgi:hypothetical protein
MSKKVRVDILQASGRRSRTICRAFEHGIKVAGDVAMVHDMHRYRLAQSKPDVVLFYGYGSPRREIMAQAINSGINSVYVDLGYWDRIEGGRFNGYHKVSINALHPDAYFQRRERSGARADRLAEGRWRPVERGDALLIPGMSEKGAWTYDYKAEEWERRTIAHLRKITDRPIIYRPKPSWKGARPIDGVEYSNPAEPIHRVLERGIWAIVNHHSNVAIDALLRGIPNVSVCGVAAAVGHNDVDRIEEVETPDRRTVERWKNQVAWTQWNVREMNLGVAWQYVKKELYHTEDAET